MINGRVAVILTMLLPIIASGCAKNPLAPARISGKITYNGQPLKGGNIAFYSESAGVFSRPILADSTYSVTDLPAEEMAVTIETESLNPGKKAPEYGKPGKYKEPPYRPPGAGEPPAKDPGAYIKIPAKYADPKTSGLSYKLTRGSNTKDFDLKD